MTLNPAEWDWENLKNSIRRIHRMSPGARVDINEWNGRDPVLFAHYFHNRVLKFLREVVLQKRGPFGEILHHFAHYEWQGRGTAHNHMVLWSKEDLMFDGTNEEDIIKIIDSTITCRIPDQVQEPIAHDLVMSFQRHSCTGKKFFTCIFRINN